MRVQLATLLCTAAFVGSACAMPKVMVGHEFLGASRTTKLVIQKSAEERFDTYVRICNLTPDGQELNCVDTLVLSNVNASSVY